MSEPLHWKDAVRAALDCKPLEVLGVHGSDAGKWWPTPPMSTELLVIGIAGAVGQRTYRLASTADAASPRKPYGWARTSGPGPKGAPLFVLGDRDPNADGFWGDATYLALCTDGGVPDRVTAADPQRSADVGMGRP